MSSGRIIVGAVLILVGIGSLTGFNVFRLLFPALLIWWGYTILSGRNFGGPRSGSGVTTSGKLDEILIFSGVKKRVESTAFTGGRIVSIFGNAEIDLTHAKAENNFDLEIITIFGGVKLRVPVGWVVNTEVAAILGSVQNKTEITKNSSIQGKITGASLFGGIEISN